MSTHLRLLTFLKAYKKEVVFACVVVVFAASFTMVMPQMLRWAIDSGLKPSISTELSDSITASDNTITVKESGGLVPDQVLGDRQPQRQRESTSRQPPRQRAHGRARCGRHVGEGHTGPPINVAPDQQTFKGKTGTLLLASLGLLAAAIARGVFTYWMTFMASGWASTSPSTCATRSTTACSALSYAYHDKQQTGQLMSRATQDVEAHAHVHPDGRHASARPRRPHLRGGDADVHHRTGALALVAWAADADHRVPVDHGAAPAAARSGCRCRSSSAARRRCCRRT